MKINTQNARVMWSMGSVSSCLALLNSNDLRGFHGITEPPLRESESERERNRESKSEWV